VRWRKSTKLVHVVHVETACDNSSVRLWCQCNAHTADLKAYIQRPFLLRPLWCHTNRKLTLLLLHNVMVISDWQHIFLWGDGRACPGQCGERGCAAVSSKCPQCVIWYDGILFWYKKRQWWQKQKLLLHGTLKDWTKCTTQNKEKQKKDLSFFRDNFVLLLNKLCQWCLRTSCAFSCAGEKRRGKKNFQQEASWQQEALPSCIFRVLPIHSAELRVGLSELCVFIATKKLVWTNLIDHAS